MALHMTVGQMLDSMTMTEYRHWVAFFERKASDRRIASGQIESRDMERMTPEQISKSMGF